MNRQNISYSGINCALGPSKSIHYSGVCLHMFYCNSAGLSDFFRYNGIFVIIVIVTPNCNEVVIEKSKKHKVE